MIGCRRLAERRQVMAFEHLFSKWQILLYRRIEDERIHVLRSNDVNRFAAFIGPMRDNTVNDVEGDEWLKGFFDAFKRFDNFDTFIACCFGRFASNSDHHLLIARCRLPDRVLDERAKEFCIEGATQAFVRRQKNEECFAFSAGFAISGFSEYVLAAIQ